MRPGDVAVMELPNGAYGAGDVFRALADRASVPPKLAAEWFDDGRDF